MHLLHDYRTASGENHGLHREPVWRQAGLKVLCSRANKTPVFHFRDSYVVVFQ